MTACLKVIPNEFNGLICKSDMSSKQDNTLSLAAKASDVLILH